MVRVNEQQRQEIVAVFRAGLERRGFRHVMSVDGVPYYKHGDGRRLKITKDRHGDPKVERLDESKD